MRWLFICLLATSAYTAQAASLLIILDDMGNNQQRGEQAIALTAPLNLAFLPHTPQAKQLAEQAYQHGHGIMLHLPMASLTHKKLGPGGLYPNMDKATLQRSFNDSLASIPHVQGFNNHMGSLLTQQLLAMQWVMESAKEHNLFFVDSLTTPESVAAQEADKAGIPTLKRHVFLDNERTEEALKKQFSEAVYLAKKQGYAVLIGHPYPETLAFLEQALVQLLPQNVQLMRIDQFLQLRLWQPFDVKPAYFSKFQLQ